MASRGTAMAGRCTSRVSSIEMYAAQAEYHVQVCLRNKDFKLHYNITH